MKHNFLLFVSLLTGFIIANVHITHASELTLGASLSSDNFRLLDPQHAAFGAISSSSSSSFHLAGVLGDIAIGSSSISSFRLRTGFLYFPKVTAPVLNSATAGNAEVALAWTAASALQGLSVGGYKDRKSV